MSRREDPTRRAGKVVHDLAERVVLVGGEERCCGDERARRARRRARAALTRKEQETREQLSGSAPQVHSDDRLYGDVGTSYPAPNDLSGASQT